MDALGVSRATYYRRKKDGKPFKKRASHNIYLDDWVEWRESGLTMRPWSSSHKELQLHYIGKYFETFLTVSPANLESWLDKVPAIHHSKRKHMHSTVSSFAKYLRHRAVLDGADYLKIRAIAPKRSPYHPPKQRIINTNELDTLIETAQRGHQRYQRLLNVTLLTFLSETGLRASECSQLVRPDLRFSNDPKLASVIVQRGKGGKRRVVPFSKRAQEAVSAYLANAPEGNRVFYSFNPTTGYTELDRHAIARRFAALSDKTGIDFCPHSLRHYRITAWANNARIPIAVVQRWAGHASLEITQRYIHIGDDEALQAAFE